METTLVKELWKPRLKSIWLKKAPSWPASMSTPAGVQRMVTVTCCTSESGALLVRVPFNTPWPPGAAGSSASMEKPIAFRVLYAKRFASSQESGLLPQIVLPHRRRARRQRGGEGQDAEARDSGSATRRLHAARLVDSRSPRKRPRSRDEPDAHRE